MAEILEASTPNVQNAAPVQNAVPSLDQIAEKMAAMRRNLPQQPTDAATGSSEVQNK